MKPHVIATVLPPETSVRCSICLLEKSGRVYDAPVALWDETGCTARTHGVITVCRACRNDFDAADNELDGDAMFRALQPESMTFADRDQLYDDAGIYPPERNDHWTFPKGSSR